MLNKVISTTSHFITLSLAAALAACSANPVTHGLTRAINLGQGLPEDMVNRHMAGVVAFDEQWTGGYSRVARNALYSQGVQADTPEYGYRAVRINLHNTESALWVKQGQLLFMTGAYVPNHLPQLHAGDIVEIRQSGSWMTMHDFAKTGEGNVVVRVLCTKADPKYQECAEKGPRTGEFKGVGATNTPYPASLREYGFTFTPMFDAEGHPMRAYPEVTR